METVFREVFGSSPIVRVLDFFLDNQEFGYSLADVVRSEGIAHQTAAPIWKDLVRAGVLIEVGRKRKARLYTLDTAHPLVQRLLALNHALVESRILQ